MSTSDIIDNTRRFHQAIKEYTRLAERNSGLTGPQLWALQLLYSYEPLRLSELADFMYLRPATVVGIIDRLESKALVTRERSHADRRAVELRLTEKGMKLARVSPTAAQKLLVQGLNKLTQEEYRCVEIGIRLIVEILKAENIDPLPLH